MPEEWLSPLALVQLGVPVELMAARQSRVLLPRWQNTSISLRRDWQWHGGHWQHLGVSRAVKVAVPPLCHPPSKETPGAVPGPWWHQVARGSTVSTLSSWGGRRQEGASAREGSSGWVVCASSRCRGRMSAEPGPLSHRQPGHRAGGGVRPPVPPRVALGDTAGAGTPEQGLAVTRAAGGSVGRASCHVTTGLWTQTGLPGEQ